MKTQDEKTYLSLNPVFQTTKCSALFTIASTYRLSPAGSRM